MREKLIEYLDTHCIDSYGELQTCQVADFIIADRKRIVEPLVKYSMNVGYKDERHMLDCAMDAIDETLRLSELSDTQKEGSV